MSMRVLIADPDHHFANQATRLLESRAHLVVNQSDAGQAALTARHWRPDLAIVAEELAETGLIEEISSLTPRPAILMVGWMDRYDRVWRAWQRGGDELLMKPVFTNEELHTAIVAALENAAVGTDRRAVAIPA